MTMKAGNCGPVLTANKIRQESGCRIHYQVDPLWGVPAGGVPMFLDPITKLIRPFTSAVTRSLACENFVGFTGQCFNPGECVNLWIHKCGVVQMKLATPGPVEPGQLFAPSMVTDASTGMTWVSDDTVEPAAAGDACALFKAIDATVCSCVENTKCGPQVCPPGAAPPMDVSPTVVARPSQVVVLLAYGDCC